MVVLSVLNLRYPTLATMSCMTTGNKHYAVAEGETCLLTLLLSGLMLLPSQNFKALPTTRLQLVQAPCRNMERSMQGPYEIDTLAFTTLISADSFCQSFELLLEPHKRIQAIYFCCNQSMVIIDLADSAASLPSLIVLNVN